MNFDLILFDLDGTLTDPTSGLRRSYRYALEKMGVDYGTYESLSRYIGPSLVPMWMQEYGFSKEEADRALDYFREFFEEHGWHDNRIFDGIYDVLSSLRAAGKRLALATSKPSVHAEKILGLFDLTMYFDFIGAADLVGTRDEKWQVIEYVLEHFPDVPRDRIVIVGDRRYDCEGARRTGIHSLGVLYGCGAREEMEAAGFDALCERVSDVAPMLLS